MSTPIPIPAATFSPAEVVRKSAVTQAANGLNFASLGEAPITTAELERMVAAVPIHVAGAVGRRAFYFVPLTVNEGDETRIAEQYDVALSDKAVCHRNLTLENSLCVFISTRLMDDKFSVAFEFYINVGHAFVEQTGVSQEFVDLVTAQVEAGVKGETSLDAHELRKQAFERTQADGLRVIDEKSKTGYLNAAFSDAIAIYMLSLYLDVDYYDLREREYPLLSPAPLAERLRKIAKLFPANPGYEFAVFFRRRP
ncbi:MAG TPA: hypothetical protein VM056_06320 [Terriglobales bacterium]|nr:hypothetical protein [Terriglobales bacterium]